MTKEFVMRVQEDILWLVMQNAACHAESARTLSSANISHAWLCITVSSLLTSQHHKFPDPDIFAFDIVIEMAATKGIEDANVVSKKKTV